MQTRTSQKFPLDDGALQHVQDLQNQARKPADYIKPAKRANGFVALADFGPAYPDENNHH